MNSKRLVIGIALILLGVAIMAADGELYRDLPIIIPIFTALTGWAVYRLIADKHGRGSPIKDGCRAMDDDDHSGAPGKEKQETGE